MGYGWLNLGSIVFGLLAWVFPFFAVARLKKGNTMNGVYLVYSSFISALLSVLFVVSYRNYLINIEDWSALMDTKTGFQIASVVMISVTIVSNAVPLAMMKHNK